MDLFSPTIVRYLLSLCKSFNEFTERRYVFTVTGTNAVLNEAGLVLSGFQLIVGFAQLTALIPGVSRSGATIVGGLLSGLDRPAATGFSFYLAMPTLGAATLYSLVKDIGAISGAGLTDLAIGLVVSFITALLAIGWLLRYIAQNDFRGLPYSGRHRCLTGFRMALAQVRSKR